MGKAKVLMIGIDAGDLEFIRNSGARLPQLRGLVSGRPLFELETTGLLTSSVWPTFSTGTMPGEHGVYYPMQWDAETMTLRRLTRAWLSQEPFWAGLARSGVRATVLDVPFSLPGHPGNEVEVLNWGSQECLEPFGSNRPDLAREVRRRFGVHPMGTEILAEEPAAKLAGIERQLVDGARRKAELARWLMQTTEWDLFLTVFGECHRGGHLLWPEQAGRETPVPGNALRAVYEAVDAAIRHVMEGAGPETTVLVFSLHGMRANDTQEHFVLPMMARLNAAWEGDVSGAAEAPAPKANPMRILREVLPPTLQARIAEHLPAAVRDWVVQRAFCGGLDWSRTPAFALPASGEGYLRFNLKGRESQGSLEPGGEAYARYTRWLKEQLFSFHDAATQKRVVKDVVLTGEAYPGPRSGCLPDAIVLWNEVPPAREIYSATLGRITGRLTTGRTGDHRAAGFAAIAGNTRGVERLALTHIAGFANFARQLLGAGAHPPAAVQ